MIDMQHYSKWNDGYKYILAAIDVFSKYGWMRPLKNKSGADVAATLNNIMEGSGRAPEMVWVDKGKEFYNSHVQKLVSLYSTENEEKSCIVETWNRTMKSRMFKYFTANNTNKYIDVLQDMVDKYNNTKHSSTKMTPVLASNKENETTVYRNLY